MRLVRIVVLVGITIFSQSPILGQNGMGHSKPMVENDFDGSFTIVIKSPKDIAHLETHAIEIFQFVSEKRLASEVNIVYWESFKLEIMPLSYITTGIKWIKYRIENE
jgi:hypothetical protein